uniref:SWIM-type domain-containing protein n=1 Tax=Plectus sambesii TaxID=2011161 RepID=A0A914X3P4_9BILA
MNSKEYMLKDQNKKPRSFGEYFAKEYVINDRCKLWARFGRLGSDITTNMHLESFHRTLKQRYLKRMCNRRLDYVMHILMTKVAPDFASQLERAITMCGASSTFQERVKRDHIKAKYLLDEPDKVEEVENGRKSTANICQVCPHCYKCSCPYFEFRCGPMPCKHIHAVHSLFAQNAADFESDKDDVPVPSLPELPPIDAYSSEGDETINADASDAINTDPGAPNKDTQQRVLLDQFCTKKAAIMQQLQMLDSLLEQCDDKEEIEAVLTM